MKRCAEEDIPVPVQERSISTLQELLLQKIVSSFTTESSLAFYLALIPDQSIRVLLLETWRRQKDAPLVVTRRTLRKVELVVHYLDSKETASGIISQTVRTHATAVACNKDLMDFALQKIQLKAIPSRAHRNPKFLIY
jgi:hypothetical protein